MPNLLGLHDLGGEHLMEGNPGHIVDAVHVREMRHFDYRPQAQRGIRVLCRLNWGWHPDGTIPEPAQYGEMAARCRDFVAHSQGCDTWIIGNEFNHIIERPNGREITPEDAAGCHRLCYAAIKQVQPTAKVLVAAVAPWNEQSGPWLKYLTRLVTGVGDDCDGYALHAYTHGPDPALISSDQMVGLWYWHFRTYLQQLLTIVQARPAARAAEFHITESNQGDEAWLDRNNGWVQAAAREIDSYNQQAGAGPFVQSLSLYRWRNYPHDKWGIEHKQGVIDDFRAAVAKGYQSPQSAPPKSDEKLTMHIPALSTGGDNPPAPQLPPRDIDPRAEKRGTKIQSPAALSRQHWRVTRLYTPNEAESDRLGPDRHILANVLVDGQRQVGVPLLVTWGGGGANERATIHTKNNPGFEFSADHALTPGEWTIEVADGKQSERVIGIRMGDFDADDRWNPGAHTSTLVNFELVTIPEAQPQPTQPTQPAPSVGVPLLAHPVADPARRVISQRFGENPDDYARFGLAGHTGIDFAVPVGTPIAAVDGGVVLESGVLPDYGEYIKLRHPWGESLYAHLQRRRVQAGEPINRGLVIATSGNTGFSTGPHLHFAIRIFPYQRGFPYDGFSDPAPYLANSQPPSDQPPVTHLEIVKAIAAAALEFDVDPDLLLSQAWAESSFDPRAVSSAGAQGLLQIMPATWAEWSPKIGAGSDPFDPQQNARVGAAYLKWLLGQTSGNAYQALIAYGWGIGNWQSDLPRPSMWVEYANKIVHGRDLLKAVGA